jgi:dihydrolipoamide dehydrogenase
MAALSPRTSITCSPPPDGGRTCQDWDSTGRRSHSTPIGVPLFNRQSLQCGRSSIFIAGDVNNELPLLHEAADEGRIAGENAAHYPDVRPGLRRAGIAIVFTDPEIAIVGGGWREAQPVPHVVGEVSFHNQGRSRVMLRNKGLLHVYVAIEDGAFLGRRCSVPMPSISPTCWRGRCR